MRLLAGLAITYCVVFAAAQAAAQSIQASNDVGAAQLMNAAFAWKGDTLGVGEAIDLPRSSLSLQNAKYDLRLTPHAALGSSDRGRTAEAGAVLTFGLGRPESSRPPRLNQMGLRDGARLDQTGRWYMFAAASGRAVGLNMSHDRASGWDRAWSQDTSSALIGDAQLGLGWRRGDMQTSLGLIHRTVKGDHMIWGQETREDSVLAFSWSMRPQR